MNPIKQGLREVLVAVNNGHSSATAISSEIGAARSTVIERLRQLREADMVSSYNNIYKPTKKGVDVMLNAPVIKKGDQVHAYSLAKATAIKARSYELYVPIELQRPPGVTEDRFHAFTLPSRRGSTLFYPDGRTEQV
jgi:DNA-binding Lrp family transcriptional regulator